jgi:hypothetical protein
MILPHRQPYLLILIMTTRHVLCQGFSRPIIRPDIRINVNCGIMRRCFRRRDWATKEIF